MQQLSELLQSPLQYLTHAAHAVHREQPEQLRAFLQQIQQ
jgi:pimeloyl-ACP methyl ester carboxylesterase